MDDETLIRHFYAELDRGNFAVFQELCTPDFLSHFPGVEQPHTREGREQVSRAFYKAFPDLRHAIEDLVADAGLVAVRLSVAGTSQAPLNGLGPTGKEVRFSAMRFYRVIDGRLAEEWVEYDNISLSRQLSGQPGP